MFGFQSKKKLQARAEELIWDAQRLTKHANTTEDFVSFMETYNELLACAEELSDISDRIVVKGMIGNPKEDYISLKFDKQWHIRDALESQYNKIVKEGTTIYRNNRGRTVCHCECFRDDIDLYTDQFDEETIKFATDLLKKLSAKFQCVLVNHEDNPEPIELYYDFDSLDGIEFEYWCANLLRCNGFDDVEVTQSSGDHGVDIIAEKDDIRYAIQCKCYSSDLGNTPVQEVCAGKSMYHCHIGAVMTNRYFTKGAQELAASTGVLLWDRDKILKMLNI